MKINSDEKCISTLVEHLNESSNPWIKSTYSYHAPEEGTYDIIKTLGSTRVTLFTIHSVASPAGAPNPWVVSLEIHNKMTLVPSVLFYLYECVTSIGLNHTHRSKSEVEN